MVITYLLTQSYEQLLHKVLPSGLHCNEGKRTLMKENVSETTDGIIVFSFLKIGCHGFCSRKLTKKSTTSCPALQRNMELASGNQALESSIRYRYILDARK